MSAGVPWAYLKGEGAAASTDVSQMWVTAPGEEVEAPKEAAKG